MSSFDPRRESVVESARRLVGVPFAEHGRTPDCLDCGGLILLAASRAGMRLPDFPVAEYTLDTLQSETVRRFVWQWGKPKPCEAKPVHGDIVLFWLHDIGQPCHAGIYAEDTNSVIHARPRRGVVEEKYSEAKKIRTSHVIEFYEFQADRR